MSQTATFFFCTTDVYFKKQYVMAACFCELFKTPHSSINFPFSCNVTVVLLIITKLLNYAFQSFSLL